MTATKIKTFEVGKTYSTRSVCDSDCVFSVTIASRTKSTVTTTDGKKFGIAKKETAWNEAETIFPTVRCTCLARASSPLSHLALLCDVPSITDRLHRSTRISPFPQIFSEVFCGVVFCGD